jgi:hypothetical protein
MCSDSAGVYGEVFYCELLGSDIAVKSFPYSSEDKFFAIFKRVLMEWTMLRICSVL